VVNTWGRLEMHTELYSENLKVRYHLGEQGVVGKIIS
jgi:hypothetical protein